MSAVSDSDVRSAYKAAMSDVLDALNAHPNLHGADVIDKGGLFLFVETSLGKAAIYFSGIVYGGLMSDRQRADAEAHADVLVERIREREMAARDQGGDPQ